MSNDMNKTMLVPVDYENNSLTNYNQSHESYSSFHENILSGISNNKNKFNNSYSKAGNPFLYFASNVFKQIHILQNSYDIGSIDKVRELLVNDINYFTNALTENNTQNSEIMLAQYILCAFCDELIGTTYWGKDNNWSNNSLLVYFHNETYSGKKFFQILQQLLKTPARYIDLLELMYMCLSLGFEGKYRIQNRGKMELDSIRENLYKQLKMVQVREYKSFYGAQKSPIKQNYLIYKTSYQILTISILVLMSLVFGILTLTLSSEEDRVKDLLSKQYKAYNSKKVVKIIKEPENKILSEIKITKASNE